MARILIVDDRPVNRQVLIEILKYNHELIEAADGAEALALAKSEHPDLVITDVLMPSMDGYEFVRLLRADSSIPQCPVVFYTAHYIEKEASALATASGVTRIIYKPCEPEKVLQIVDEALKQPTPPAPAILSEELQEEHQRLLTNKLAQKVRELETANNRLRAIVEFGIQLGAQRTPDRVLEEGCRAACGIAGSEAAAICILDEGLERLDHVAICGSMAITADDFLHLHHSFLEGFLVKGHVCRLHDADHPLLPTPPVHSLLAVPILSPTRAYGWLLLLDKPDREAFSDSDERVARMIAAKVGSVYENGLYFMEIERRSRELENEVMEREMLEEELRSAHDEMETQITERTAELARTVDALRAEVAEREQAEAALLVKTEALVRSVEELSKKDKMLVQQSRQAAMGEMIGNIAHQWRQPLNALGLLVQGIDLAHQCGDLSREYLEDSVEKAMETIFHMSRTIDDFRNFFRPDKEKVAFHVSAVVARAIALVKETFDQQRIRIDLSSDGDPVITGYPNEYSQALLNILLNARDALRERDVADAWITVKCFEENARAVVMIADNAGGIAEEIMDRIFDPYFTTKFQDKGTGIGLFMAKAIIEKNMNGTLSARNSEHGAEFTISV